MAVLKSPLFRGARGKFAGNTLLQRGGQTILRQATSENTNPRTASQMERRVRLANLVTMYRAGQSWMPKAFQGKRPAWSDFNAFVSANLNTSPVALTKEQAAAGACVCAPYLITKGNLFSVAITKMDDVYNTNILCDTTTPMDEKTVADLSKELVAQNRFLNFGDQLSFVSYQQVTNDVTGFPQVLCASYEITLDPTNTNPVEDYMPPFCFTLNEVGDHYYIGTGTTITNGGFAYIISRRTRRGIEVSTQQLFLTDTSVLEQFSSQEQLELAAASYGYASNVFLDPSTEDFSQDPGVVLALQGIAKLVNAGTALTTATLEYAAGTATPTLAVLSGNGSLGTILPLFFNNSVAIQQVDVTFYKVGAVDFTARASSVINPSSTASTTSQVWGAQLSALGQSSYQDYQIAKIVATTTTGEELTATFTRSSKPILS